MGNWIFTIVLAFGAWQVFACYSVFLSWPLAPASPLLFGMGDWALSAPHARSPVGLPGELAEAQCRRVGVKPLLPLGTKGCYALDSQTVVPTVESGFPSTFVCVGINIFNLVWIGSGNPMTPKGNKRKKMMMNEFSHCEFIQTITFALSSATCSCGELKTFLFVQPWDAVTILPQYLLSLKCNTVERPLPK